MDSVGFHWNLAGIYFPLEFHGIWLEFQWIPMETVPGGSRIPVVSIRFRWIPSDSIGISMELETRMAEASAIWIPSEFHGIPWNSDILPELMGEGKDLHAWLIGNVLETCTRGVRVRRQLAHWDSGTRSHARLNTWILC